MPQPGVHLPLTAVIVPFAHLAPDDAVLLGALGVCLGFVECNRPGRIVPGALGLRLFLFASASLLPLGVRGVAVLFLASSAAVLAANLWRMLPTALLLAAVLGLIAGLRFLVPAGAADHVHTVTAVLAGTVVGTPGAALSRIAFCARRSKALD